MRLIDADALKKNMEFVCMGIMAGTEPYNAPIKEIDSAPTIEPRRKTWKWIPSLNMDYNECSFCHRITEPTVVAYKFCPYCGAAMTF